MDAVELQRMTVACKLLGTSLVEELEKVAEQHRLAYEKNHKDYLSLRRKAIQKFTDQLDATLKDERAKTDTLHRVYIEAQNNVLDAKISKSTKDGLHVKDGIAPVGARVKRETGPSYSRKIQLGVVEVRTPETVLPEEMASYKEPSIGDCFIRICKKDGKPGLRIAEWAGQWELAE